MDYRSLHPCVYLVQTLDCGLCIIDESVCGHLRLDPADAIDVTHPMWKSAWRRLKPHCDGQAPISIHYQAEEAVLNGI